jgi:hypothetical protein
MMLKNEHGTGISPFLWGLSAGAALLTFSFGILTLSSSFGHAIEDSGRLDGGFSCWLSASVPRWALSYL